MLCFWYLFSHPIHPNTLQSAEIKAEVHKDENKRAKLLPVLGTTLWQEKNLNIIQYITAGTCSNIIKHIQTIVPFLHCIPEHERISTASLRHHRYSWKKQSYFQQNNHALETLIRTWHPEQQVDSLSRVLRRRNTISHKTTTILPNPDSLERNNLCDNGIMAMTLAKWSLWNGTYLGIFTPSKQSIRVGKLEAAGVFQIVCFGSLLLVKRLANTNAAWAFPKVWLWFAVLALS